MRQANDRIYIVMENDSSMFIIKIMNKILLRKKQTI